MSASAMPRPCSAAMTACMIRAASSRAAPTSLRWTVTPRLTSATSGVSTTLPVPLTEIVCSDGVPLALPGLGDVANAGPARMPTNRPAVAANATHERTSEPVMPRDLSGAIERLLFLVPECRELDAGRAGHERERAELD